jgi:Histidine kinase-, DNA gyrase B-, and HSP90-like ATPase
VVDYAVTSFYCQQLLGRDMSAWRNEVPITGTVDLPPDPHALDGLGRNHSLPTALADLVDNSIDAHATHVLIRTVRQSGRLRALYVVDNGDGITPDSIDEAMTVGRRRVYAATDLGRFGLGMKAASFSQARSMTVLSKASDAPAVGRRWLLTDDKRDFHCDVVSPAFAEAELERSWDIPWSGHGTVVRWDEVTAFPATDDPDRIETFISHTTTTIAAHLGLVFHRLLGNGAVNIGLDVEDVDAGTVGLRSAVSALNPFGYLRSGKAGYPKDLIAVTDGHKISFRCHIWPGRSNLPQFRLPGGGPEQHQGFYFYRRDRLLQAGGDWYGVAARHRGLQLARVEINIDGDIARIFRMNPEKSRILAGPEFGTLAEAARSEDGVAFIDYLRVAEDKFHESRQRSRKRHSVIPPGKGFAPQLRRAIQNELPFLVGEKPIDVRWARMPSNEFFEIDRSARTLRLNIKYRRTAAGERHSVNDAPLLKALLYLLMEDVFKGEYLGPRDKDNIELWQEILTTAAESEPYE